MLYRTSYPVYQTIMVRLFGVLLLSLLTGMLLAGGVIDWPLRPGLIGLVAMIASAWAARRYWQGLDLEAGPGSPERALWHGLASYGLLTGHLGMVLWRLGPEFDMHSLTGHALAIDNWTLVLGAILSYWIARDPEPRQDERDALFAAQGWRAGHIALLVMLLLVTLALGFGAHTWVARLTQPMLAHVLILAVLIHCLVQYSARLRLYWLDALAARRAS